MAQNEVFNLLDGEAAGVELLYAGGAQAVVGPRLGLLVLLGLMGLVLLGLTVLRRVVLLRLTVLRRMALSLRLPMLRRALALTDLCIITRSEGVLRTRDSAWTTGLAIC